jgi:Domain of unknown function (DUF4476)
MKCWIVSLIMFLGSLQAFGQQEYFIYLQTDNHQSFYARLNNKIYSSEASGYLILSKLPDSTCTITIGFPKNIFPEQQFNIPVNRRDAGFSLTNLGDKGWGLLNLQTLAVIMNSNPQQEKKSPEITGSKSNNSFALLLANVVNDTAILYTVSRPKPILPDPAVAIREEKKKDSIALVKRAAAEKDSIAAAKINSLKKDSLAVAIREEKKKDSIALAKKVAAEKDSIAAAKINLLKKDSLAIVKTNSLKTKNAVKKNVTTANPVVIKTSLPKTDTAAFARKNRPAVKIQAKTDSLIIAKNKSLKKDSVAIVKKAAVNNKNESSTAKNNLPKTDSTGFVKKGAPKNKAAVIVPKKEPARKDTSAVATTNSVKMRDTIAVVKNDVIKKDTTNTSYPTAKPDSSAVAYKNGNVPVKPLKLPVTKAAELLTDTSYIAVFIDQSKEKYDTIRISIPFIETAIVKKEESKSPDEFIMVDSPIEKKHTDSSHITENIKKEPPAIKKDTTAVITRDSVATVLKPAPVMINSDCKEIAWDSDIDKLRIKMLLVKTDDEKIILAKKLFKQKCFTVKQVKALSELFTADEGKYKWFDAVYSFVADSDNFAGLGELIKEEYYLNRFKAMLRK